MPELQTGFDATVDLLDEQLEALLPERRARLVQSGLNALAVAKQVPGTGKRIARLIGLWWGACFLLLCVGMFSGQVVGFCSVMILAMAGTVAIPVGVLWLVGQRLNRVVGPPEVTASSTQVHPGESLTVEYRQAARVAFEVEAVNVRLLLRETATYRRGTDTYTDTYDHIVQEMALPGALLQPGGAIHHKATITFPPTAMHTFSAPNNKLGWLITLEVLLSVWPNRLLHTYVITVLPERSV